MEYRSFDGLKLHYETYGASNLLVPEDFDRAVGSFLRKWEAISRS